jgi:hypothetical protein
VRRRLRRFLAPLEKPGGRLNSPSAQTTPADCPRPSGVAQRLPRGPEKRPRATVAPQKIGFQSNRKKRQKLKSAHRPQPRHSRAGGNDRATVSPRVVSSGPLRGAEQRRGWRKRGEDCLRAKPEFRSALNDAEHREEVLLGCPRSNRVAQGTGAAGTDTGVAFSLATFFWPHKRKYARQQGGTPS